jgi:hypothetical protein
MTYDLDFRYRRALQPSGLNSVTACLEALNDAVVDARYAGVLIDQDPAIKLLARRLGRVADGDTLVHDDDDEALRHECTDRLTAIDQRPAIIGLVARGVGQDKHSLTAFRREGQRTLRALAFALGFDRNACSVQYTAHRADLAGDHELTCGGIYVRLSGQSWLADTAFAFRSNDWTRPGSIVRHAPISAAANLPELAALIRKTLGLATIHQLHLI